MGDEGWGHVFKDPREETVAQDDGTDKKMQVDEAACLKFVMENKKRPPCGFWMGGKKYTITSTGQEEKDDVKYDVIKAGAPVAGASSPRLGPRSFSHSSRTRALRPELASLQA